jgi:hypothetical protein
VFNLPPSGEVPAQRGKGASRVLPPSPRRRGSSVWITGLRKRSGSLPAKAGTARGKRWGAGSEAGCWPTPPLRGPPPSVAEDLSVFNLPPSGEVPAKRGKGAEGRGQCQPSNLLPPSPRRRGSSVGLQVARTGLGPSPRRRGRRRRGLRAASSPVSLDPSTQQGLPGRWTPSTIHKFARKRPDHQHIWWWSLCSRLCSK